MSQKRIPNSPGQKLRAPVAIETHRPPWTGTKVHRIYHRRKGVRVGDSVTFRCHRSVGHEQSRLSKMHRLTDSDIGHEPESVVNPHSQTRFFAVTPTHIARTVAVHPSGAVVLSATLTSGPFFVFVVTGWTSDERAFGQVQRPKLCQVRALRTANFRGDPLIRTKNMVSKHRGIHGFLCPSWF